MEQQGRRLCWDAVPSSVQERIAELLGSPVAIAENQPGGFSPGLAARCRLEDGRRCFIKAVSSEQNPMSPVMHRVEGRIAAALPHGLPVPDLIDMIDDGDWVVLIFEDIEGVQPAQPWSIDALAATFDALDELTARTTPCPIEGLPSFADRHTWSFDGFRKLAAGDPAADEVDPWTRRHLAVLAELEGMWEPAAAGSSLLHCDLRADNLLIRPDGTIVVVDWPHACTGASWVDKLCMLPSVGLDGGPSPAEVEAALDPFGEVDATKVDRVLVGLAGYFTYQGSQPDPVGIPTLRGFQRAQGEIARRWLADRLLLD